MTKLEKETEIFLKAIKQFKEVVNSDECCTEFELMYRMSDCYYYLVGLEYILQEY
ncbi:hypothetical protein MHB40_20570 [Lysinibacillus sp. FSL K6-0057]|uniref:hypothetical protein n=1 Tax=Lysinibacillus sp. FSL K6-0057 TaxID=2921411 RepID=UPI00315B0A6E